MALYNIKSNEEQFVQKYRETFFFFFYSYIYSIQSTNKIKPQHLTDKDTSELTLKIKILSAEYPELSNIPH